MARKKNTRYENTAKRARRRLRRQSKAAAVRGMYGASGEPAPVTIKSLDGKVVDVVTQKELRSGEYCRREPTAANVVRGWLGVEQEPLKKPSRSRYALKVEKAARAAGYESYTAYLSSPYWRDIRQQVRTRDHNMCVKCGSSSELSVHHNTYASIGAEDLRKLKTMCWPCHKKLHEVSREKRAKQHRAKSRRDDAE